MSEITVVQLKALCEKVLQKRKETDDAEEIYKKHYHECDKLENELISTMTELNMRDFKEAGMLFLVKKTRSVTVPKEDNKLAFLEYLKQIGHFESLVTVNSRTLNSWYNQELENSISRGEPILSIPGLDMPTERVGLTIKKTK